jgi:hypothetical protein
MIPTADSTYGIAVDTRWTCGVFTHCAPDGTVTEFELPFIGWATQVRWTVAPEDRRNRDNIATNETVIVPVFLHEDAYPATPREIEADCAGAVTLKSLTPHHGQKGAAA